MTFEYDQKKSEANKLKHGIDFEEVQELWLDHRGIEIEARTEGEHRRLLIAVLDGEIWSVIFTRRDGAIRIISARRSRKNEKEIYLNPGI
jgi:uncharacterized protein